MHLNAFCPESGDVDILFFTNWLSHKPHETMFKKRAVVIATAAGAGAGKATKLVADNLSNWGIPEIIRYGISVNAMNWNTGFMAECKRQTGVHLHRRKNIGKAGDG